MTVREIVDRVETNLRMLGIANMPGEADILLYVNSAHEKACRDLKIPRRYVTGISATEPFVIPSEAVPASLEFAEKAETDRRIQVLTVREANEFYPDWERNEYEGHQRYRRRLIVYDPGNISAPIYPIGFQPGDELRLEYRVRPTPLVLDNPEDDEGVALAPFFSLFPDYDRYLYQIVTFELTLMLGGEEQAQKARAFYADAQRDLEQAFSAAHQAYTLPRIGWAGRP